MTVPLEYIDGFYNFPSTHNYYIAINVFYIFLIMLALCLMLAMTHYAQNYAGIMSRSLAIRYKSQSCTECSSYLHIITTSLYINYACIYNDPITSQLMER